MDPNTQRLLLGAAGSAGSEKTYVDDVFSTYLYTGNGSTQTITNGIDLAGKGGLVWCKSRSNANSHALMHAANTTILRSDTTGAQTAVGGITSWSSTGFSIDNPVEINQTSATYVSWTFRKAPKFFDVVTYTGDGVNNRNVAHALGIAPGMVIVKKTGVSGNNWHVWHRSGTQQNSFAGYLNTTDSYGNRGQTIWGSPTTAAPNMNAATFSLGDHTNVNENGATYVAYLFAHDTSTDGLIQCGSFTTDISGGATVNLGWEPQFVLIKNRTRAGDWHLTDAMRGMLATGQSRDLLANTSGSESGNNLPNPTATGFSVSAVADFGGADTYIYLAIRRPNKPPTSGTQVFRALSASTNSSSSGGITFQPDIIISKFRGSTGTSSWVDRLRGPLPASETQSIPVLRSESSNAEASSTSNTYVTSVQVVAKGSATDGTAGYFLRRAPGFFDVVCYTGNGGVGQQWPHSLGVQPELIIQKARSTTGNWVVAALAIEGPSSSPNGLLNTTGNLTSATYGLSCKYSTATTFYTDFNTGNTNVSGTTYVAYLFATKAGISKVFSYTGNGSSQTINCGFTNGARFVLIKRSDNTGNWLVADTARGLVSGNDPVLYLNSTAAEVTNLDWIDPDSTGFTVVQEATANANVNNATYIGLAIA